MTGVVTFGEQLGIVRTATSIEHASEGVFAIGGAEGNVAIGLARLGTEVAWAGRVGDDPLGRRALSTLRAQGVAVHGIVDADAPTALLLKDSPLGGRTRVTYHRRGSAGSRLTASDLEALPIESAALLHVTGISLAISDSARDAVHAGVARAVAAGVAVSFDVNHRPSLWSADDAREHCLAIARQSALLFAGEEEVRVLVPDAGDSVDEQLAALAGTGARSAVLKRGPAGASVLADGVRTDAAAVRVDVVDTVGAGDAFVAGYLAQHVAGAPVADALATAVRTGAFACTVPGDWEGAPTRADLALLDGADPVIR